MLADHDIRNYRIGDWVLFRLGDKTHEGKVEVINKLQNGCLSIDVLCKDTFYKHVPINDVIERLRVGIDGDTCVIPVRWESPHGERYERKNGLRTKNI